MAVVFARMGRRLSAGASRLIDCRTPSATRPDIDGSDDAPHTAARRSQCPRRRRPDAEPPPRELRRASCAERRHGRRSRTCFPFAATIARHTAIRWQCGGLRGSRGPTAVVAGGPDQSARPSAARGSGAAARTEESRRSHATRSRRDGGGRARCCHYSAHRSVQRYRSVGTAWRRCVEGSARG